MALTDTFDFHGKKTLNWSLYNSKIAFIELGNKNNLKMALRTLFWKIEPTSFR